MNYEEMQAQIRELIRTEVARQVNEGQHKLNAKNKSAAHTIDRLQAKLKGARENLDAQTRRARDAEARNKALEKELAALRPKPGPAEESKKGPLADVDLLAVVAGMVAKGGKA